MSTHGLIPDPDPTSKAERRDVIRDAMGLVMCHLSGDEIGFASLFRPYQTEADLQRLTLALLRCMELAPESFVARMRAAANRLGGP